MTYTLCVFLEKKIQQTDNITWLRTKVHICCICSVQPFEAHSKHILPVAFPDLSTQLDHIQGKVLFISNYYPHRDLQSLLKNLYMLLPLLSRLHIFTVGDLPNQFSLAQYSYPPLTAQNTVSRSTLLVCICIQSSHLNELFHKSGICHL